jgi:ABC-type nickel/cobalt efflux system permease component RcnA
MMVIPTQSHVTLYYGRTAANTICQTLEVLAWLLLLGLAIWRAILWRRRRRMTEAVHDSASITGADFPRRGPDRADPDERTGV